MKQAMFWKSLSNQQIQCNLCPHRCVLTKDHLGICGVRKNIDGELFSLNNGYTISRAIDPIEKKPLYHFLPKTRTYSLASVGCNFSCPWCQNHEISQKSDFKNNYGEPISPDKHVSLAQAYHCPSISYTYSEPTVFFEYALEIMKLAKEKNLSNIWVSNGYITPEALQEILPYLDAANIDVKGNEDVYKNYCKGDLESVLKTIETLRKNHVHVEVTTLLIPGVNDSFSQIDELVQTMISRFGTDFIWHVSRFFPNYHMKDKVATSLNSLNHAYEIGKRLGIEQIYLGNVY